MGPVTTSLVVGLIAGVITYLLTSNPTEREIARAREHLRKEMVK